jgi:hypothetical protein
VLFSIASFDFSVWLMVVSFELMMLLEGVSIPVRFRPNAAASALTAEPISLARVSSRSEGSGCQAATKSPPGPNLHSGSTCLFLSDFIFFRLSEIHKIRSVANVLSAGRVNLPKQKPNKNKPFLDFFFSLGISILTDVKIWDDT